MQRILRQRTKRSESIVKINRAFADLYPIRARYMVLYGGRRSSKSYSCSQLTTRRAFESVRNFVIMRKFATTLRLSVWERWKGAIEETGVSLRECDVNKTERSIIIPSGSAFNFVGADDPQKLKSLEDVTDFVLEEANEFDEIDFDTIDAGLSADVDPPPQIWLLFNPTPFIEGFIPWQVERFINKIPHELGRHRVVGDTCIFRSWYKNNRFCPDKTKQVLEGYKETNPELYKMWALGEYTHLEGVIFKNWDVVDEVPRGVNFLGFGLDFGFSNDPLAFIAVWKNKKEIWLDERVYATELTNQEASREMLRAGAKKGRDHIIADSAEPKSIKEFRDMGWLISPCDKGADYKRAAIRYLKGYKIHVTSRSTNLKRELATWTWKRDKVTKKFLPIPVDGDDHGIDATIYRTFSRKVRTWGVAA